jgi:hypothetical protein
MSRPPFALTHLESWRTYTKRLRDGDAVRVMALDHVSFEHTWPGFWCRGLGDAAGG